MRREAAKAAPDSAEGALLNAVLAQYDGDVEGAVRILRRQLRAPGGFEAALADTLAPILVMRHENDSVRALARRLEQHGWIASAHSLRALAAADDGDRSAAREHATAAHATLAEEPDEIVRLRVLQRLARSAFYLEEHEQAIDLALASAGVCVRVGAWRAAAACYSIAYNVHHNVTGDAAESDRFARLWRDAASRSGDESFVHAALVAEYGLAVEFADVPRIAALERLIEARLLPQQYTERFGLAFAYALVRGGADMLAMRTLLQVLRDTPGRSRAEWALCAALVALAEAARADDEAARQSVRAGVQRLGRALRGDPAYERRYRRLARASIAAACLLLGDEVRAERTIGAGEMREGQGEDGLLALMRAGRLRDAPAPLRGIARVFAAALEERRRLDLPAGLTGAEFEVLRLLGNGWSAGRIARETDRSVNTIYSHTRSILEKLHASRAAEAVAIARARGLLT